MIKDFLPGAPVAINGIWFKIMEVYTFHDVDCRLDLVALAGNTPAHSYWIMAINGGTYLALTKPLSHNWLSDPVESIYHNGTNYSKIFEGGGFCVKKTETAKEKDKDGRFNYILFSNQDGKIILTIGQNFETSAFIGELITEESISLNENEN